MARDYYEVLGVGASATDDAIKKAYRTLARKYHPDQVRGPEKAAAEARFKEISAAYDTLGDPDKRKAYDQLRQFGPGYGAEPGTAGAGAGGFRGRWGGFGGFEPQGFGGGSIEDLLSGMFGGARTTPEEPREVPLEVTLEEAAHGTSRELMDPRTGKRLRVKIPPGVAEGSRVRAGEVVALIHLKPHALFRREAETLRLEVPLTFWEAIEGSEVEIPTLEGTVKMKVPPRTQSGRTFRLKGKGMPHLKGEGRGDLLVTVYVHLPPEIDDQALALWRRLAAMSPYDPRATLRRGGTSS